MMDDFIQRTINTRHSVNEYEQVYAIILDMSIVKARELNQTPTLFKNENTTKTVWVSKHCYTCHIKVCFAHPMKNNYRIQTTIF